VINIITRGRVSDGKFWVVFVAAVGQGREDARVWLGRLEMFLGSKRI
jgi:hypothetical protein